VASSARRYGRGVAGSSHAAQIANVPVIATSMSRPCMPDPSSYASFERGTALADGAKQAAMRLPFHALSGKSIMLARCSVFSGAPRARSRLALHALPFLGVLFLVLVHLGGCNDEPSLPEDTCNRGITFQDPRLGNGIETIDGMAAVRVTWSPGTERGQELPQAYFADVFAEADESVALTATNEVTVVLGDLAERLAKSSEVSVTLYFPDRAEYIDCTHPGMRDTYLLHVVLHFDDADMLQHSELTEEIIYGAI
jgi:hypothetical protein